MGTSGRTAVIGTSIERTHIGVWSGGFMGVLIGTASLIVPGVAAVIVAGPLAVIVIWLSDRIRRR